MLFGTREKARRNGDGGAANTPKQADRNDSTAFARSTGSPPQNQNSRKDNDLARTDAPRTAETAARPAAAKNPARTDSAIAQDVKMSGAKSRAKLHEMFGKVALAMMREERYAHVALEELQSLILEPLVRDRIAFASAYKDGNDSDGALAGIAIWASVSEAVEQKIKAQIEAGTFPVRLTGGEWNSGETRWLLDVLAPNERTAKLVVAGLQDNPRVEYDFMHEQIKVHPQISQHQNQK